MNWILLSLLSAFFVASADACCKKSLVENNEYLIAWVRVGFAAPFLLLILPFIQIPKLDIYFFLVILILLPLEITALILYMKAIKLSPLSLTLPFLALSPIFLIFTSNLMLGERLDRFGIAGILLTAIGAYLLNVKTTKKGILEPFKAIGRERGSMYMIIVAFIYSITSNLGKMAILHSSPLFFASTYLPILAAILFPILMWKNHGRVKQLVSRTALFSLIGLAIALSTIAHFWAVSIIEVPYVISVKRMSLLFGIMYGALWFKETNIAERLIGGVVMIIGVVIITLF
ncbi:MAG: EamA family transporter [Planctomycetota bacterium]|nr:EamA family transporter [Planctomycetota bacterium]MDE1890510.1 EamA family transporter [Planctomycetota bacterium]MDE2217551.1 EamA family transporter [Planctomycetota bacterium]